MGIITFLTDFGVKDPYVGIMKGVVLGLNPNATIVDLTHQVEPGDIIQAAHIMGESFSYLSAVHNSCGCGGPRGGNEPKTDAG